MGDYRFYKISLEGGSGSFLCPPKHPRHTYSLHEYVSSRGRKVIGIFGVDYALNPEANASPALRAQVEKIMSETASEPSDLWIRFVYGYFRNSYAPEDLSRNVTRSVTDPGNSLPPGRHLAVLMIQEYFPDHQPRTDLITDPGKGYGSWPCNKCGERVQYEAKLDKLAVVSWRMTGYGGTVWSYAAQCPEGGDHATD